MANVKSGLVLEGGGMRGIFTAGVLDFFLEKGLEFDECLAVSAGACHACSFLANNTVVPWRLRQSISTIHATVVCEIC